MTAVEKMFQEIQVRFERISLNCRRYQHFNLRMWARTATNFIVADLQFNKCAFKKQQNMR